MSFEAIAAACLAGLQQVVAWPELGLLTIGVLIGAVVGILPGLGGSASLAILLPLTFTLPPTQAFALLLGMVAVVATTGDLTSILVGIPGEATAAATVIDGHQMTRRGEAARAIGASVFSSLAGAIFGALVLAVSIPFALALAQSIGSPELFMLALLGIAFLSPISRGSRLKGLIAGGIGMMLATIGQDAMTATPRFTFGQVSLWDGIGPIPLALGLFAIPEIVQLAGQQQPVSQVVDAPFARLLEGVRDVRRQWAIVLQSSAIGTVIGILPGVGASVTQWLAYGVIARRKPEAAAFGEGAIEGVIAPSAANNATLGGSLIPALALGVPGGVVSAMLLSALIMKGLVPGPTMLLPESQGGHLSLVFAFVWLLAIANFLGAILACASTKLLVAITRVSGPRVVPLLLALLLVGAFAERQALIDLLLTAALGGLGLAMVRFNWPRPPVLMGLVLGPLAENRLFLSIDAYGASWLWRPGVLLIGAALIASLFVSGRTNSSDTKTRTPRSSAESWFAVALIVILAAAFTVADGYEQRAALLPRGVAVVTVVCAVAMLVVTPRTRVTTPSDPGWRAVLTWLPIFIILVWGLGFVIGVPVAMFSYFAIGRRERWTFAAIAATAMFLFLSAVLERLLSFPFPPGAVLTAAGIR